MVDATSYANHCVKASTPPVEMEHVPKAQTVTSLHACELVFRFAAFKHLFRKFPETTSSSFAELSQQEYLLRNVLQLGSSERQVAVDLPVIFHCLHCFEHTYNNGFIL